MVKFLLAHGASPVYVDAHGMTYLHLAIRGSTRARLIDVEQVLQLFLKNGVNPSANDSNGTGVSHIVCCRYSSYHCAGDTRHGVHCHNSRLELLDTWITTLTRAGYKAEEVNDSTISRQICDLNTEPKSSHCYIHMSNSADLDILRSRSMWCSTCLSLWRSVGTAKLDVPSM